jgi:hypothetical protein
VIRSNTLLRASVTFALISSSACSLPHADWRLDAAQDTLSPSDVIAEDRLVSMDVADAQPDDVVSSMDGDVTTLDADDARADTDVSDAGMDAGATDTGVCASSMTFCDGGCIDLSTSPEHCGSCGNRCGENEVCRGGTCRAPLDCAELASRGTRDSGTYRIDHDNNPDSSVINMYCDMDTPDGPWTEVFTSGPDGGYASSAEAAAQWRLTPSISMRSRRMLVAFRDSMGRIIPDSIHAIFPIPAMMRGENPFSVDQRDISLMSLTVGGGDAGTATLDAGTVMLRYGYRGFTSRCGDDWNARTQWGRFCFQDTAAPFYSAFASASPDLCIKSTGTPNMVTTPQCGPNRRFSIAVAP